MIDVGGLFCALGIGKSLLAGRQQIRSGVLGIGGCWLGCRTRKGAGWMGIAVTQKVVIWVCFVTDRGRMG